MFALTISHGTVILHSVMLTYTVDQTEAPGRNINSRTPGLLSDF